MKKLKLPSEVVYLAAIVLLAFSVAMLTSVDFGISMIVAPAYILSLVVPNFTFGQAEYVLQAILFVLFCNNIPRRGRGNTLVYSGMTQW